jgi:uncharacterized protein (DUF58 family)
MTPVPSRRFLAALAVLACATLGLLIAPELWPVQIGANGVVFLAALLDLGLTPRPSALRASRHAPLRMSVLAGDRVGIEVANGSRYPLFVRVRDTPPAAFNGCDAEVSGVVTADGTVRWEYAVTPRTRGRFEWGPIFLRYRSLLGFWERAARQAAPGDVRVYPSLHLLERHHLLARADRLAAAGVRRVRRRGGATEFDSLHDYTPGDDVRCLDWKATARRGRLIVRERVAERNQTVLLLLDCGRLMNATEGGVAKLDHAVNAALVLAHVALDRGDRVGLCAFSGAVHSWLAPRGGRGQSHLIADALYDLRGDSAESDHGRCLGFVAARHPKRSLLIVLTDFVDATTAAEMVAHIDLSARRHVVLFVALKDVFLDRAATAEARTELDAFKKAAALDLLHERREVLECVRRSGGLVLDADPGEVTPRLISRYLEVMLGGRL